MTLPHPLIKVSNLTTPSPILNIITNEIQAVLLSLKLDLSLKL
jgi:hypothetical protein